jgi:hypothetical protein
MRIVSIVVAIVASGCITHHTSKLGPFVKTIAVQPQGMIVVGCQLQYETTKDYTFWWYNFVPDSDHDLTEGQCWQSVVPMGGL